MKDRNDKPYDNKHAVSVLLVYNMNRFERGEITKLQLLALLDSLEQISVDDMQRKFFGAYRNLIDKVEAAIGDKNA